MQINHTHASGEQFGLFVPHLVAVGGMARSAADALQRAADRAKRRAELEVAKIRVEKTLGYEIDENQFPWVSLSMP